MAKRETHIHLPHLTRVLGIRVGRVYFIAIASHSSPLTRYYFPGVLVGPYLEYADYNELIHETLYDGHEVKGNNKGRKLPSGRKRVAYRKMVTGLVFLGIFVVFGGTYNYTVVLTDWFAEQSLLYRYVTLCLRYWA